MYGLEIREDLVRRFHKMSKKHVSELRSINKKIVQIRENPHMFKPLRGHLAGLRRVHIEGSFVLMYSIDEKRKVVVIEDYGHHDDIYSV